MPSEDTVCNSDLSIHKRLKHLGRSQLCMASRHGPFYGKFRLRRFKSSKVLEFTFVSFTMDCISVQLTWPHLLFKILSSVFSLFFYLVFSSSDSQPTRSLGTKNTGSPQLLTIDFLCLMDYSHEQLTQLLQFTSFKIFLVLAFFSVFFVVAHTYRRRSIKKQPPRSRYYRYILKSHLFRIFSHLFVLQNFRTFQTRT